MPHVGEGTLHALLDGALRAEEPGQADAAEAHLAGCADCRALLEEAISVRGRSAELLAMLEPATGTPDFDEVLVRAGRDSGSGAGAGRLARQARWTRGVAWAATITIALGTGYLIRDRLVPERAAMVQEATDPAAPVPASSSAPGEEDAGRTRNAGSDAAESASTESNVVERRLERETIPVDAAPPSAPVSASDGAAPRAFSSEAAAGSGASMAEGMPEPQLQVTRPLSRARDIQLQAAAPASAVTVTAGPREVSPEAAAALLGAPLLVLPDAELAGVTADADEAGAVVVSRQRLGEVEIRVTQRVAAAILPESAAAEAEEGAPLGQPLTRFAAPPSADRGVAQALSAPREARMEATSGAAGAMADGTMNSVHVRVETSELVLEGPLPQEVLRLLAVAATPYEPDR